MDTLDDKNTDWAQKLADFDHSYDRYGIDPLSEDLKQHKPESRTSVRYRRPSYWIKSCLDTDLTQLIADLRKPLLMMANGKASFDPIAFQRITDEIKFYEWVSEEIEDQNYIESFEILYDIIFV